MLKVEGKPPGCKNTDPYEECIQPGISQGERIQLTAVCGRANLAKAQAGGVGQAPGGCAPAQVR